MTITIADGRGALWQWDTGRRVKITDGVGVKQIHYQNRCFGRSVDVDVGADGTAIIPDELLQDWHPLMAYAYVTDDAGGYTKAQVDFAVHKRARPADYVYTPTEHAGFDKLRAEIGDLSALQTTSKDNLVSAINEAAASGGADWNQNDPTAKDYVKNRTHWVENEHRQEDYLISLNTAGVSSVENKLYKNGVIPLVVGEQVQVSFVLFSNGSITYQCTAVVAKDADGEPCVDRPGDRLITIYADHAKYYGSFSSQTGIGFVIVTRTVVSRHIHPIAAEYLIDGQEKICWTDPAITKIYTNENADFAIAASAYFYIVTSLSIDSFGLVAGKKYRVVWDAVPYDCTCVSASGYGRNFSWIGSPALSAPQNEFGSGNEMPFCISTIRDGIKIQSNSAAASRPGKHSFTLYEIGDEVVHKIPDKYIPHPFFEIKASTNGDPNEEGIFNITADKSEEDVFGALERGEVPYVNLNDQIFLWLSDHGRGNMFFSFFPSSGTYATIMMAQIAGENSIGIIMDLPTKKYVDDKEFILQSTTPSSTKKFKITVDDSGALSAVEITE